MQFWPVHLWQQALADHRCVVQGQVAAVPCKDAVRDYGTASAGAVHSTERRQLIHAKHKDWVTQVGMQICALVHA